MIKQNVCDNCFMEENYCCCDDFCEDCNEHKADCECHLLEDEE